MKFPVLNRIYHIFFKLFIAFDMYFIFLIFCGILQPS